AKVVLLPDVAQAGQLDAEPWRADDVEEPTHAGCTAERHDGYALFGQVNATAVRQAFHRDLIADAVSCCSFCGVGGQPGQVAGDFTHPPVPVLLVVRINDDVGAVKRLADLAPDVGPGILPGRFD